MGVWRWYGILFDGMTTTAVTPFDDADEMLICRGQYEHPDRFGDYR